MLGLIARWGHNVLLTSMGLLTIALVVVGFRVKALYRGSESMRFKQTRVAHTSSAWCCRIAQSSQAIAGRHAHRVINHRRCGSAVWYEIRCSCRILRRLVSR
jgi:hypothetical protein